MHIEISQVLEWQVTQPSRRHRSLREALRLFGLGGGLRRLGRGRDPLWDGDEVKLTTLRIVGNEECKAARDRAESIAVSYPRRSLPFRNHMPADMCHMQGFSGIDGEHFILYIQSSVPDPAVTLLLDMFDI